MQINVKGALPVSPSRLLSIPLLALAIVVLLVLAAPASATKTHLRLGAFGSSQQPSFSQANGLAVDGSSGDLLVIDSEAKTVSRFHFDGTPADFSALGSNVIDAKGGADQTPQNGFTFDGFPGTQQVAVDNSGTLTDGNIYVTQGIQAGGNLIDVFAASGAYLGQLKGAGGTAFGTGGGFPFSPCGVAVDSAGNLFVAAGYENKVFKFDPTSNPPQATDVTATFTGSKQNCNLAVGASSSAGSVFVNTFFSIIGNSLLKLSAAGLGLQGIVDPGEYRLVAVDPSSGHLYAVAKDGEVSEFDASGSNGALVSTFGGKGNVTGIAIDGAGRIYLGTAGKGPIAVYGPLVTIPSVTTGSASITGDTNVTLNGSVDPDGVALDDCFFEYGPTTAYGQTAPCAESVGEIGTDPKAVHADLSGLSAESVYHYRLAATNPNDTVEGADRTFKTPAKPAIVGQWSIDVGLQEATLKAQLNPENSPTTYRFEWGLDSTYDNSTAEAVLGADNVDRTVGFLLSELTPDTTYHYRVVASNGIGVTEGGDNVLRTFPPSLTPRADCPNQSFRAGTGARLPDCRAYEMVSPVNKNGSDIRVLFTILNAPARLDQSSDDGERLTYSALTAFADAKSAPWTSQYLASRSEGVGWSTHAISPPRESASLLGINFRLRDQFKAFSPDLSSSWFFQDTDPPLDECAVAGFPTLYRRGADGSYEAMVSVEPKNLPKGEEYAQELQGVSADGTHTVFRANAKLTPNALPTVSLKQLYVHVRGEGCGELRLVSILPNGKPASDETSAGSAGFGSGPAFGEGRDSTVSRAVSADGSRIYWSARSGTGVGLLYLRDTNAEKTVALSAQQAQFWSATPDGGKAIYEADPGPVGNSEIYEFDAEKALAGEAASTLIAKGAKGVVAASEDASRVYFVSREEIDGEGELGKSNLFLYDAGKSGSERYELVTTVPNGDVGSGGRLPFVIASANPIGNGVRATPDGTRLAFVSTGSLTGYDNRDAVNGRPTLEIYRYEAEGDELVCVSCNPTGARPKGRDIEGGLRRVAAQLPAGATQSFAARVLSDDGRRLFFESFDSLVLRDTNGKADVYEWQQASSEEECEALGAELYVASADGCLSLISTGQSPTDSEIADATPDGSNVFIRTASSLVGYDPGQVDIYDARENGGLPEPPGIPAACEGEACQGPQAPPDDPTPASSSFQGAGNVTEPPASCRKPKVRRKGKCVARKSHKRAKHNRRSGR